MSHIFQKSCWVCLLLIGFHTVLLSHGRQPVALIATEREREGEGERLGGRVGRDSPASASLTVDPPVTGCHHRTLTTRLAFLPNPQPTATLGTMFASPTRSPLKAKVMNTRVLSLRFVLPVSSEVETLPIPPAFPSDPPVPASICVNVCYMSTLTLLLVPSPGDFGGR